MSPIFSGRESMLQPERQTPRIPSRAILLDSLPRRNRNYSPHSSPVSQPVHLIGHWLYSLIAPVTNTHPSPPLHSCSCLKRHAVPRSPSV
ncbi:unnamed protein product [Protopolystoma xenopodis]|uniref:Uncharacterized protein n=1 Tax=Protopolystoma xenopodis TaxID=117903 RepID=A0A3S5A6L5_9PLAT|nr:unnamed protein product [Protopolystoma xenopodis]